VLFAPAAVRAQRASDAAASLRLQTRLDPVSGRLDATRGEFVCHRCGGGDTQYIALAKPKPCGKSDTWGKKDDEDRVSRAKRIYCVNQKCQHTWLVGDDWFA
jgi:hypothetical protein